MNCFGQNLHSETNIYHINGLSLSPRNTGIKRMRWRECLPVSIYILGVAGFGCARIVVFNKTNEDLPCTILPELLEIKV